MNENAGRIKNNIYFIYDIMLDDFWGDDIMGIFEYDNRVDLAKDYLSRILRLIEKQK